LNTILSESVFERTCWQEWNRRSLFCIIDSASVKVSVKANFETAILGAWAPAFGALRFAGAAYLVFLGAQALLAAFRGDARGGEAATRPTARAPSVALRQGVISNLANPKMPIFFLSLLPQFASGGPVGFGSLLALGLVFCSMTLAWLALYAVLIGSTRRWLRGRRTRRALEGVAGAALVGFGLRLASEHR
jgi:threonine/homoserine/homoserine lactone efflux protein